MVGECVTYPSISHSVYKYSSTCTRYIIRNSLPGTQSVCCNPNQSVVSPLNLYRSPCVAACLAPESAISKLVPGDTGNALPISRIHLIGYLVEDGITSSVHAKHTFSRTSIMLRIGTKWYWSCCKLWLMLSWEQRCSSSHRRPRVEPSLDHCAAR